MHGKLPKLIEINEWASRNPMRFTPTVDGLFRPEEEHGCSRKNDVVPPMSCRHGEMRDVRFKFRLAVSYFQRQRLAGKTVGGGNHRVAVERGGNSERVPNTIRVIAF